MEDDQTAERPPLSKWALSVRDEEDPAAASPSAPPLSPRAFAYPPDGGGSGGASSLPLLFSSRVAPLDAPPETPRPSAPAWVLEPAAPAAGVAGPPALEEAKPSFSCVMRLLLNILVWLLALAVLFERVENTYRIEVGIATIGVYCLYVAVYLGSSSGRALCNMGQASDATAYIAYLRSAPVRVTASISCYHYETRTRRVTRTDHDGHRHSHMETYTVRVDTHSASEDWTACSVQDRSGHAPVFEHEPIVQLRFRKVLDFDELRSREVFDAWLASFVLRNNRDVHHDKSFDLHVAGFNVQHVMAVGGKTQDKPVLANVIVHTLLVFVGLAGLFEICVLRRIPRATWILVKTVTAR